MSSFTQGIEYSISVILATAVCGVKPYNMSLGICHNTLNRFKGIAQLLQRVRNAYKLVVADCDFKQGR